MTCASVFRGDADEPDEDVDDVHIQGRCGVNGIVDRLRDGIGTKPVEPDIPTENDDDRPVKEL